MMLSTYLLKTLFGRDVVLAKGKFERVTTIKFPGIGTEFGKSISYRSDDGLILYLLNRIENLEREVSEIKFNKKK